MPALPATSIVVGVRADARSRRSRPRPVLALAVTCTVILVEPLSGRLAALIWTLADRRAGDAAGGVIQRAVEQASRR